MAKREDVAALLEAAGLHARERAWADAADQLVAAWRKAPSARIAELLVAIEQPLPAPEPIDGPTVAKRELRWHQIASTRDEAMLPRLLADPWPVHPKGAKARVIALAAFPPSPRVATALLDLLRRGRYRSSAGRVVARRAAQHLFELKDPGISQYLTALELEPGLGAAAERRELVAVLKRRRPAEPEWSAREAAALAALTGVTASTATTPPAARTVELEAAVYATPYDDGPRHVLADYLAERGDPRGEWIALQLARHAGTRATTARERQLLRDSGRTWVEALEVDGAKVAGFERGFPCAAHMHGETFAAPAWATIETLVWFRMNVPFRGSPLLRALRTLDGITSSMLHEIVLERELETLWVRDLLAASATLDIATAAAPIALGIDYAGDINWRGRVRQLLANVFGWPLGRRLRRLSLAVNATMLGFAGQLLDEVPRLEVISLAHRRVPYGPALGGYWEIELSRDALAATWCEKYVPMTVSSLADILASLPPRRITRFTLATRNRLPAEAATELRARIGSVLDRWPTITERSLLE